MTSFQGNPGDHLANERTFLAWLRTAIGIMAFGFVVVKFSLFIKQIATALGKAPVQHGISGPIGVALVALGAVILFLALLRYERTRKQIISGTFELSPIVLYIITGVLLITSVLLLIYLIRTS